MEIQLRRSERGKNPEVVVQFHVSPLYTDAMNKYGVENFIVEELEYIEDDNKLSKREIYWINELQTYGGYNATKGGDGTILYDHNEIVELGIFYRTDSI